MIFLTICSIQPVGDVGETKSMYKEVVLGGDVWDLLDELMIYMGNPMQYHEKGVPFVRVIVFYLLFRTMPGYSFEFYFI